MRVEVETKDVVYHVLSELAAHKIVGVRSVKTQTPEERHESEVLTTMAAVNLICKELGAHMDSHVGAYETAATVATCLNAGWVQAHALELTNEKLNTKRKDELITDLFNISNAVRARVPRIWPGERGDIEDFASRGFTEGTALGEHIFYATPHTQMSSGKMVEILANLNKTPNFSPSLIKSRREGR